ncbi:MAG: hypothetical protein ACOC0P_00915, partial [Planctomycetota bacterium]
GDRGTMNQALTISIDRAGPTTALRRIAASGLAAALLLPVGGLSPLAFASSASTGEPPAASTVIFAARHQSLASLLPSSKDDNLRAAVYMISDRLSELPREIARFDDGIDDLDEITLAVEWFLPLIASSFEYPAEFAIIDNGFNEFNARDIDARMIIETGDRAEASRLRDSLNSIFTAVSDGEMLFSPVDDNPSMLRVQTPIASMLWGPANDAGRFVVGLDLGGDGIQTEPLNFATPAGFPEGVTPAFEVEMNAEPAMDVMEMVVGMMGQPDVTMMFDMMRTNMPEDGLGLQSAIGFDNGRMISVQRWVGLNAFQQQQLGGAGAAAAAGGRTLDEAILRTVPQDARMMRAAALDLYDTIVSSMAQQGMTRDDARSMVSMFGEEIEREIGMNPVDDLLVYLGDAWVGFTADSTGGGGLFSLTVINQGADGARLSQSMQKMSTIANAMSAQAMGYVRLREWPMEQLGEMGGASSAKAWSLLFPGLPMPIELSMAVVDDAFIAGFSPQSVVVAASRINDGNRSILTNRTFRRAAELVDWQSATQMTYIDLQQNIDRGYAAALMGGSMLGNFVRSPLAVDRGLGFIVPPLEQLRRAVQPSISVTRADGDDIVTIAYSDESQLVNITGTIGGLGALPTLMPALIGGAAGAASSGN